MSTGEPGTYRVTVELNAEEVLVFEGYAENPSDALYKALEQREEECKREHR